MNNSDGPMTVDDLIGTLDDVIKEVSDQKDIFERLIDDAPDYGWGQTYDQGSYDAYTYILDMLQRIKP